MFSAMLSYKAKLEPQRVTIKSTISLGTVAYLESTHNFLVHQRYTHPRLKIVPSKYRFTPV